MFKTGGGAEQNFSHQYLDRSDGGARCRTRSGGARLKMFAANCRAVFINLAAASCAEENAAGLRMGKALPLLALPLAGSLIIQPFPVERITLLHDRH